MDGTLWSFPAKLISIINNKLLLKKINEFKTYKLLTDCCLNQSVILSFIYMLYAVHSPLNGHTRNCANQAPICIYKITQAIKTSLITLFFRFSSAIKVLENLQNIWKQKQSTGVLNWSTPIKTTYVVAYLTCLYVYIPILRRREQVSWTYKNWQKNREFICLQVPCFLSYRLLDIFFILISFACLL